MDVDKELVPDVPTISRDVYDNVPSFDCIDSEIDALKTSADIAGSIYASAGIGDVNSITQIDAYIKALPSEMTTVKKQVSIAGILSVNKVDINDLIQDGTDRLSALEEAKQSIIRENEAVVAESKSDIEELKAAIESAEKKISESEKRTSDICSSINLEVSSLNKLVEFADGIANPKEEVK